MTSGEETSEIVVIGKDGLEVERGLGRGDGLRG